MNKVTVIAEAGINHKGDIDMAKSLIGAAKAVGANIWKTQWYRPVEVLGADSPYLAEAFACQFTEDQHQKLKDYCDKCGIEWCISIFHVDQIEFCEKMGMKRYKVASRAAVAPDNQLLYGIKATRKPIILSVGMCNNDRIKQIVALLGPDYPLTLLYCVCDYPTRPDRINLEKMILLRNYAPNIGFSSHCPQIAPTLAAVARGASVTENHIVDSRTQEGCDVSSSLTCLEFDQMVGIIRDMENLC